MSQSITFIINMIVCQVQYWLKVGTRPTRKKLKLCIGAPSSFLTISFWTDQRIHKLLSYAYFLNMAIIHCYTTWIYYSPACENVYHKKNTLKKLGYQLNKTGFDFGFLSGLSFLLIQFLIILTKVIFRIKIICWYFVTSSIILTFTSLKGWFWSLLYVTLEFSF